MAIQPSLPARVSLWDVVAVDFPFADSDRSRRRPALVVALSDVDPRFSVAWVLMITTAGHSRWPGDAILQDWDAAGLPRPCCVRTAKIATIDTNAIASVGRLSAPDRANVAGKLQAILSAALLG